MKPINERGITLVELLAAITITVIISTVGYALLFNGFETFNQVKAETELRDEADLIMTSLLKELYTVKSSDIEEKFLPELNSRNYYLLINNDNTESQKYGFIDGKVFIKDKQIILNNNIKLSDETKIEEIKNELFKVTLVLETNDKMQRIETVSEIGIIKDDLVGGGNNEKLD